MGGDSCKHAAGRKVSEPCLVLLLSDCAKSGTARNWSMAGARSCTEITVSIVEDDDALRETLARYVDTQGFRCLSAYGSAEEALREMPKIKPDVVLMDINLPRKSGIDCVAELKGLTPGSKCIILTAFEDADLIFQALTAGALGYL